MAGRTPAAMRRALAGAMAAVALLSAVSARADPASIIQARVGQLLNGGEVKIDSGSIASTVVLPAFYERRDYRSAWTDPANVTALFDVIRDSSSDGLTPEDYHLSALEALRDAPPDDRRRADFDLLATDALVRLAYHLRFGKVDRAQSEPHWNLRRDYEALLFIAPVPTVQQALDHHRLRETVEALRPGHPVYARVRQALARYRSIEAAGGWKSVPAGDTIRPGVSDRRVPRLRARLLTEGDLAADAPDAGMLYDEPMQDAVRAFQRRHGLAQDASVGRRTRRALNVPVEARVDQLRLSLERARLVMHDLPERSIVVNVPAFRLYYLRGGAVQLATNVVVGKVMAKTPIFRADMTHIVLNPSWTVPPFVLKHDILPGLRKHPDYLLRKGLEKIGGEYVQPPGPNNALGRIKLMFPNPYFVYLHDTPQRSLFERETRTFSSGCVRVQDVFELAELALDDPQHWSKDELLKAVAAGQTQTIVLSHRLPVLIAYWTAGVDAEGRVFFYEDIYDRDPAELRALDGPFLFSGQARTGAAGVLQQQPR